MSYCDNCGEPLATEGEKNWISELGIDIDSANAGESAVLCSDCSLTYHHAMLYLNGGPHYG
jgi:hypothetical protein